MLPRLSQRTYDLMRRAIDAVDRSTADLITTLVASAFVDGKNDGAAGQQDANAKLEKGFHVAACRLAPCAFWPTGDPVSEGYPAIARHRQSRPRWVVAEVEPHDGPPVPCGGDLGGHSLQQPNLPRCCFTRGPCSFHFWLTAVPVSDAYPGISGSRTCLRVVAGVKPQAKPRGEASAAACAFWRASTRSAILALAGSIPQRYLRPRAATVVQPPSPFIAPSSGGPLVATFISAGSFHLLANWRTARPPPSREHNKNLPPWLPPIESPLLRDHMSRPTPISNTTAGK
jgi:hypothetical protein